MRSPHFVTPCHPRTPPSTTYSTVAPASAAPTIAAFWLWYRPSRNELARSCHVFRSTITASPVSVVICTSPTLRRWRCTALSPSSAFNDSYSPFSPAFVSTVMPILLKLLAVEPAARPADRIALRRRRVNLRRA